jgi:hypothetical protein
VGEPHFLEGKKWGKKPPPPPPPPPKKRDGIRQQTDRKPEPHRVTALAQTPKNDADPALLHCTVLLKCSQLHHVDADTTRSLRRKKDAAPAPAPDLAPKYLTGLCASGFRYD